MLTLPYKIILASGSPRRKEILSLLGLDFEVRVKDLEEDYPTDLPPKVVPEYLAQLKAKSYLPELADDELLITADTVVIVDNEIIGKPQNRTNAIEMLQKISGRAHLVITGVCLTTRNRQKTFSSKSKVHIRDLSLQEIEYYVDTYHPFDKAGAYGVQDWLGAVAIHRIKGSYYNIMGLPSDLLYNELKTM